MDSKLTIFTSKKTSSKIPYSPFDDRTFIFENISIKNNQMLYNTLVSHFILNLPLERIKQPIRKRRALKELQIFYADHFNYFILDIEVRSEHNKEQIINYFKDYKVIIGESRSYDGYSNFNLKGVIFTDKMNYDELKLAFAGVQKDLEPYGYLNENTIKRASLNAPILKNKIFYNNENGVLLQKNNTKLNSYIKELDLENQNSVSALNNITGDSVQEICLKTFKQLGFKISKENQNSSLSFIKDGEPDSNYFWFRNSPYTMHNQNRLKSINIFNLIKQNDNIKDILGNIDFSILETQKSGNDFIVNEELLKIEGKEQLVDSFINNRNGLFSIKSPMGTGKGILINYIIEESHNQDMKVLIITNRVSVAEDFSNKYEDMKLYNKDSYNIGDSLIVQYDSLWKYNISYFDIIIMDEFTSLLLHSRDNVSNNQVNLIKFFGCFNKKLVIADAFLTGYEYQILNKTHNITNIVNDYRDPTKITGFQNKNRFFTALKENAINAKGYGRTTTISCTSTSVIYGMKLLLEDYGLKVITLTADTPKKSKDIIYEEFSKNETSKWDVIIFSPTLTVGVSCMNNVEDHFHYDTGNSADVVSSIQMIKRSRRAKNIHYYVAEKKNYNCTDYNTIRDTYLNSVKLDNKNSYLFDTDDYGELRLSKVGRTAIHIDVLNNILSSNHKKSFDFLLGFHFTKDITINTEDNNPIIESYINKYKKDKMFIENCNVSEFSSLANYNGKNILTRDNINIVDELMSKGVSNEKIDEIVYKINKNKKLLDQLFYYNKITDSPEIIQKHLADAICNNKSRDVSFYTNLLLYKDKLDIIGYRLSTNDMEKLGKNYRNILMMIGYEYRNSLYTLNESVSELSKYMIGEKD